VQALSQGEQVEIDAAKTAAVGQWLVIFAPDRLPDPQRNPASLIGAPTTMFFRERVATTRRDFEFGGRNNKVMRVQERLRHANGMRPKILLVEGIHQLDGLLVQIHQFHPVFIGQAVVPVITEAIQGGTGGCGFRDRHIGFADRLQKLDNALETIRVRGAQLVIDATLFGLMMTRRSPMARAISFSNVLRPRNVLLARSSPAVSATRALNAEPAVCAPTRGVSGRGD